VSIAKTGKHRERASNCIMREDDRLGRPSAKERRPYNSEAIADVAVRVFLERGYDGASLDDVARAAGITKASIYYHVRSKEDLLARGVGRAFDALGAAMRETGAKQGSAEARLKYIVRRTIEITVVMRPEVALLLRVRGNTRAEKAIVERRRAFDHLVARHFARAQRAGEFRRDIDPRLATRLLFGMLNSITEWYRPGGELGAEDIVQAVFRLAFEGLKSKRQHAT
jgi:AcrR family transcriptional regulator